MKYFFVLSAFVLTVLGCASKKGTTESVQQDLDAKMTEKVGVARKNNLITEFGNPEWCKNGNSGGETCRFYLKKGTRWIGDKKDRKSIDQFDEVIADFDGEGILRTFKTNAIR